MAEVMEEMAMEMPEESTEDKIAGIEAEIAQMKRMIEANEKGNAEHGEDEGRNFMIKHLQSEITNKTAEVEKLKAALNA